MCGTSVHQPDLSGSSRGNINNSSSQVRAAVVDAHHHIFSIVKIRNPDIGTEGEGAVSGGELGETEKLAARGFFAMESVRVIGGFAFGNQKAVTGFK